MKKYFSAFFILLFIFICFSILYINIHNNNLGQAETTLAEVFSSTGASVVSSEIYFWSDLGGKEYSFEELEALAAEFSMALGLDDDALSRRSMENDYIQTVEINGTDKADRLISINLQRRKIYGGTGESFASVSVMQDVPDEGLEEVRSIVLQTFKDNGLKPRVNWCITGTFDGKLDGDRINEIGDMVLKAAGARKVEGVTDEHLMSVSAYSPMMGEPVMSGDQMINLNLAIRYNSYEDKTYIWLGTPVITIEY